MAAVADAHGRGCRAKVAVAEASPARPPRWPRSPRPTGAAAPRATVASAAAITVAVAVTVARYAGPGTSHRLGAGPPRRQPSCRSHVSGAAIGSGSKPVGHANGTPSRSAQPPKAMPLE